MKSLILLLLCAFVATSTHAQQPDEKEAIKKTMNTLFEAMRKGDTVLLKSVFAQGAVLHGVAYNKEQNMLVATDKLKGFIKAVGAPHKQTWDERAIYNDIKIDGDLASVWAPYKFYLGTQFSHCGVDIIQLSKAKDGWKIIYLVDNSRKDNCPD